MWPSVTLCDGSVTSLRSTRTSPVAPAFYFLPCFFFFFYSNVSLLFCWRANCPAAIKTTHSSSSSSIGVPWKHSPSRQRRTHNSAPMAACEDASGERHSGKVSDLRNAQAVTFGGLGSTPRCPATVCWRVQERNGRKIWTSVSKCSCT